MNVQLEDICGKRETVLNSTLALIRQYGFHGTPMSMIAKHAGVAAGTIYHYFESKDALINALYEHESSRLAASLLVGDDEGLHYKERFFRCNIDAKLLMPIIKGTLVAAANFHLRQHMVFSDDDIKAVISMIWDGIKKQEKD